VPPGDAEALAEAIDHKFSIGGGTGATKGRVKSHAEAAAELADFLQTVLDARPQRRANPSVPVAS
jgi:hypothetical protein